jgi:SAM-dependent methyltransferase
MKYFEPHLFELAQHTVVGAINNLSCEERWTKETPLFADAIVRLLQSPTERILDYGCGIGRMSKEILARQPGYTLVGVDNSPVQLQHARTYVADQRFSAVIPHELSGQFDTAFSLYVLQHVRAVDLRQAIERIHAHLRPDGLFIQCCSKRRMSVRDDQGVFFDDRFLGVDVEKEIERLFTPIGDLFTPEEIAQNDVLRRMVIGFDDRPEPDDDGAWGDPHPAKVYRRKPISVPYWCLPPGA